jgi:hypothetical protein
LGVRGALLRDWLRGKAEPERSVLARVAGFLRRVGYL